MLNTATTYLQRKGERRRRGALRVDPSDRRRHDLEYPDKRGGLERSDVAERMVSIRTNFKDQAGLRMFSRARKLIVPPQLEPVAIRLTKTELRPGTADNDVNAILSTAGGLPEGYMVMDFLTSNYAWFLLTNIAGLAMMNRIPFESDMQVDFVTDSLLVKGYARYSFGYFNWRAIWGSFPTSYEIICDK